MKKYRVSVNGKTFDVTVEEIDAGSLSITSSGPPAAPVAPPPHPLPPGADVICAPMPGKVLSLKVKEGQEVKEGDLILILEAMKMENDIFCGRAGRVLQIRVSEGDSVNTDDVLVVIG